MKRPSPTGLLVLLCGFIFLLVGCLQYEQARTPLPPELTDIIAIVESGDRQAVQALLQFSPTACSNPQGLGGPPECAPGEPQGTMVEVLPMLGPEGHFLRKEQVGSWSGLDIARLYAVYVVSGEAFSDKEYPAGEYALVFIDKAGKSSTTLQIRAGKIVRIDQGFSHPPHIPAGNVQRYLIPPPASSP